MIEVCWLFLWQFSHFMEIIVSTNTHSTAQHWERVKLYNFLIIWRSNRSCCGYISIMSRKARLTLVVCWVFNISWRKAVRLEAIGYELLSIMPECFSAFCRQLAFFFMSLITMTERNNYASLNLLRSYVLICHVLYRQCDDEYCHFYFQRRNLVDE